MTRLAQRQSRTGTCIKKLLPLYLRMYRVIQTFLICKEIWPECNRSAVVCGKRCNIRLCLRNYRFLFMEADTNTHSEVTIIQERYFPGLCYQCYNHRYYH